MEPFSSWLWHWLHNVMPRHPLHTYRPGKPRLSVVREWLYRTVSSVLPVVLFFNAGGLLFTPLVFLALVVLPLSIINALSGITAATVITGAINREREQGRYDLMGLAPSGLIGAGWVLTVRQMRNNLHILYLKQLALRCYLSVLLMMGVVLLGYWANTVDYNTLPLRSRPMFMITMLPAFNGFMLFLTLWADYYQSLAGAGLLGMLIPTFTASRLEGLLYAFTGFLLMQVMVYLVVALVWLLISVMGLNTGLVPALMAFVTLFALREILNFALLRLLMRRANTDSDELKVTLHSGL